MTVASVVVGATTDSSAVVVGQVSGVTSVRLAVDTAESLPAPSFTSAETPDAQGMVRFQVGGLVSNERYFFQLETDSALDGPVGQFRTHPPLGAGDSDVLVALAGDGGRTPDVPGVSGTQVPSRMTNHPIHAQLADQHDPLMFIHLGDEGYYNLGSGEEWEDEFGNPVVFGGDLDAYRAQYEDVFRQPNQAYLARRVSRKHVWDNHEFGGGPDVNPDKTLPGRDNACLVYREREPYEQLPAGSGANPVYDSIQIDRTLYVFLDTRSDRDPHDDPDGPDKSMLGASQRAWLDDLLTNSTAQALVVISSTSWLGVGAHSWASYEDEQNALVQLFTDTGFLDRMVVVNANTHFLAIEDGSNNDHGGFPVYVFAPLDASPTSSSAHTYSRGFHPAQSGQYGTLRVVDTGDEIRVTGTGWINGTVWNAYTLTTTVEGDEPGPTPPDPTPEPVATAVARTRVTWLACDVVTGRRIMELPDATASVERVVSAYTSTDVQVPAPTGGPGSLAYELLQSATEPVRTLLVLVVNDVPTWGGWILERVRGTDAMWHLPCVTLEGYLRTRRVRSHKFSAADLGSVIGASVAADAGDLTGVGSGIGLVIDGPATGVLRDRTYLASDRQTVYDALRELAGIGLEWTVDLDWADDRQQVVTKILRLRTRIGRALTAPKAIFATKSESEATYQLSEDHTTGRYANYLIAYSPGEGEDQLASDPVIDQDALDAGVPIVELHWQPSSSIIDVSVLDEHAARRLAELRHGTLTWELTARWDRYPRLNVDWALGDDIGWQAVGHGHPDGVSGRGRAVGWKLDTSTGLVSPQLLDPASDPGEVTV